LALGAAKGAVSYGAEHAMEYALTGETELSATEFGESVAYGATAGWISYEIQQMGLPKLSGRHPKPLFETKRWQGSSHSLRELKRELIRWGSAKHSHVDMLRILTEAGIEADYKLAVAVSERLAESRASGTEMSMDSLMRVLHESGAVLRPIEGASSGK
jgi:hypothetical protein